MGRAEFLDLVDGYLAGTLAPGRLAALEGALQAQPETRLLLLTAVQHEILLRQYAFEQLDADAPPQPAPTPAPAPAWWRGGIRPGRARFRAAALFLLGLGLLSAVVLHAHAPSAHLAQVAALLGDGGGDPGVLLRPGRPPQPLRPGMAIDDHDRLTLPHGASAELRLEREETAISLGGGGELGLGRGEAGVQLALAHGSLTAAVAHQAAGRQLTITTPQAAIAVIGTRLAVSSGDQRTSVAVDEGRVRVRARRRGRRGRRRGARRGRHRQRRSRWPPRRPCAGATAGRSG